MSLLKIGLIIGVVVAGQFYWQGQSPEKRAQLIALLPFTSKPQETEKNVKNQTPVKTKTTVYQTQGRHGEVEFSDGRSITRTAHVRVVNGVQSGTLYTNASDQKKD